MILIAFVVGAVLGGVVGSVGMALLVASREEYAKYHG